MSGFTIQVPATMANMGPGFDSFGLAVDLYNRFTVSLAQSHTWEFQASSTADVSQLSTAPENNLFFQAMSLVGSTIGKPIPPVLVRAEVHLPIARGLGSSSTAVVAGLMAASQLMNSPLSKLELLNLAVKMEGHPDNVAPAFLGGVVLYDTQPYALPWPNDWKVLALIPPYPVLTEEARRILPQEVTLTDSIFNLRKASVLTYALLKADANAFSLALQDRLHQPYRGQLISEFPEVQALVQKTGALGCIISGSGSTMAVFYQQSDEQTVLGAFRDWGKTKPGLQVLSVGLDAQGASFL